MSDNNYDSWMDGHVGLPYGGKGSYTSHQLGAAAAQNTTTSNQPTSLGASGGGNPIMIAMAFGGIVLLLFAVILIATIDPARPEKVAPKVRPLKTTQVYNLKQEKIIITELRYPYYAYIKVKGRLNVRSMPWVAKNTTISSLPKGKCVHVTHQTDNGWLEIRTTSRGKDIHGYVSQGFLISKPMCQYANSMAY